MKTHRTSVSVALVIIANLLFGTGCVVETDQMGEGQFDDIGYEAEDAEMEETVEPTGDEQLDEGIVDENEDWGLCGPKCTKI